jgi:hypothetical protein
VRGALWGEGQRGIEGRPARGAVPPIARARHLDLAEDRHHAARLRPLVRVRASVGSQDGLGDRPRTPLVQVGLQQATQQCAACDFQPRLQVTMDHLVGLRRAQVGDELRQFLVGRLRGLGRHRSRGYSMGKPPGGPPW